MLFCYLWSLGLTRQYISSAKRINNFVKAVERAADVKKENLAIERKLAEESSVSEEDIEEPERAWWKYLKKATPWVLFIIIMLVIGYFIVRTNATA